MTRAIFGYVYSGTATYRRKVRQFDGTAWSLGPCDEIKLRAAAMNDLSESEDVPLAEIEIESFWFSEVVSDGRGGTVEHPCTDPFSTSRDAPDDRYRDTVDPFRPAD